MLASKIGVSEGDCRSHTHCESWNHLRTWQLRALFSFPYPASLRSSGEEADVLRANTREDKFEGQKIFLTLGDKHMGVGGTFKTLVFDLLNVCALGMETPWISG